MPMLITKERRPGETSLAKAAITTVKDEPAMPMPISKPPDRCSVPGSVTDAINDKPIV